MEPQKGKVVRPKRKPAGLPKPAARSPRNATSTPASATGELRVFEPPAQPASEEAIAEVAHRLFVERGGAHGHDLDDWFEAERRLRANGR